MKFNKQFNTYAKMFLENTIPQEHLPVRQGDQVIFKKGWDKLDYFKSLKNSSTGERIRAMIEQQKDPLIASSLSSRNPSAYGAHGSYRDNNVANESEFMVTVCQQYALGLYSNIVVVPMEAIQNVDNGANLTALSKNQDGPDHGQTTGTEYKQPKPSGDKFNPVDQTHAVKKDHGINKLG